MKSLLKKTAVKKQKFQHFTKLSNQQMIVLKGGDQETPPEEENPKRV